jgi:hypothetical protein
MPIDSGLSAQRAQLGTRASRPLAAAWRVR